MNSHGTNSLRSMVKLQPEKLNLPLAKGFFLQPACMELPLSLEGSPLNVRFVCNVCRDVRTSFLIL